MHPTRRRCLAWLAGLATPLVPMAARAQARPFPGVMLARVAPADVDPAGWLVSEKLDGVRALWDGTQLRFRSGALITAPPWFLAGLPATPLDGELWAGRGRFEWLSGTVRQTVAADAAWRQLRYEVFDLPGAPGAFAERASRLTELVRAQRFEALHAVEQRFLVDRVALRQRLDEVLRAGGEGLMLHRADALWRPGRSDALLKLKPVDDAEAVVIGHLPGGGRHAGRLGALRVRTPEGIEFLLGTGLTDAEREHPPAVGSVVTYVYRGRTASGVPRFASFLRKRDPERS